MKMSKSYKALLLAGVLTVLGGSAVAASYTYNGATYDSLWNVGGEDTTFTDWDVTVDSSDAASGKIGRDDGKSLTFEGGSITSSSANIFQAGDNTSNNKGGTIYFGTKENPLTSFYVKKGSTEISPVGMINGANSVVDIYVTEYKQDKTWSGIQIENGGTLHVDVGRFTATTDLDEIWATGGSEVDIKADEFTSISGRYGIYVANSDSAVTITAETVDITPKYGTAISVQGSTESDTAPENAASVNITADTIKLKSTFSNAQGVQALSNGQINLTGNTTIEAPIAVMAGGNSTVNINTDGSHTTEIQGDVVFRKSDNYSIADPTVNANVNLNLTGADSSWKGSAYQQNSSVSHGTDLDKVAGFNLTIADGATWDMTGDSFVNTATVNGGSITVSNTVNTFNADDVTLANGAFIANGGTTTINMLNASGDSTLTLSGSADVTLESGEADLDSITTSDTSSLTVGSDAVVKADTIDVDTSATLKVGEGANLAATKISATGEGKIAVASDATVEAEEIKVDTSAKLNVASGATVKADSITANESSTVEFASGSNVSATMYVGTDATVKALGNFSGTFYKPSSSGDGPVTLSNDEVKEILGLSTTTTNPQSMQLENGDYTVKMDVDDAGNFNLRSYDLSGNIKESHQLGTWDTKGNYTAYGNYDAQDHDISNVGTLSAKNITLNGADIASGKVASGETAGDGSSQLVTGKTMYEELRPTDGNYVKHDQTTAKNLEALDAAMGKVSDVGDAEKGILDKDGHLIGSSESGYGANLTDAVRAVDEKVGDLNTNNEFRDTDGNLIGKYNVLDSKESLANNLEFIDHALGTTADGAYVSSGNSVGQNLNALDQGLSNLDRGLNDLGDRLNKVGAGAAALAALHPEGFDPDDKLSFAVGYGHYKNANASAIGAFYKPNRDTTFSIASTIGNGSTMLNAGVSFKLGKSSHVEKTMVVKADYEALQQKVAAQEKKLAAQDEKMAAQDERLLAQDAQIEELKKQVALLMAKG